MSVHHVKAFWLVADFLEGPIFFFFFFFDKPVNLGGTHLFFPKQTTLTPSIAEFSVVITDVLVSFWQFMDQIFLQLQAPILRRTEVECVEEVSIQV